MPSRQIADNLFHAAAGISQELVLDTHGFVSQAVEAPLLHQARIESGFLYVAGDDDLSLAENAVVEAAHRDPIEAPFGLDLLPLRIQPADPLHRPDDGHLGRTAGAPDAGRGDQASEAVVQTDDRRKGGESPAFGDGREQAPLPQMPAREQFIAEPVGHQAYQLLLLFVECVFELLEGTGMVCQITAAAIEGRLDEIDEVGAPDLSAVRGGQLCREQLLQPAEIAAGALTG